MGELFHWENARFYPIQDRIQPGEPSKGDFQSKLLIKFIRINQGHTRAAVNTANNGRIIAARKGSDDRRVGRIWRLISGGRYRGSLRAAPPIVIAGE